MKKIIILFLFVGFSVWVAHPFFIDEHEHDNIKEYVVEFDKQVECGDMCELHFAFHIPFTLDKHEISFVEEHLKTSPIATSQNFHFFKLQNTLIKPPIA